MLELAAELLRHDGRAAALATVVDVAGSAPHPAGTSMLVTADGAVVGSVSGGCVEGAVLELAGDVIRTGVPVRTRFGITDDAAHGVGLTCGGQIEVVVAPVPSDPVALGALTLAAAGERAGVAVVVGGPRELLGRTVPTGADSPLAAGVLTDADLRRAGGPRLGRVVAEARAALQAGRTGLLHVECGPASLEVFCESAIPPARFLICGANQYAVALAQAAAWAGYRVTVVDARPAFATPERFPTAEVVRAWPHDYLAAAHLDERTAVCVLTHDPKFDVPLLCAALRRPLAYVGAMGSRRTHDERTTALRAAGCGAGELTRLRSPIGLDLGARTPEETAISILAEVLTDRSGTSGLALRRLTGPVHRPQEALGSLQDRWTPASQQHQARPEDRPRAQASFARS